MANAMRVTYVLNVPVGELLREWRVQRRLSQLELSATAGVSTRHLSFVENGRSRPSREMVLHLSSCLRVPLRDRNRLLIAAGFAPMFLDGPLDDPGRAGVRAAIDAVLAAHEPWPAIVVDRMWDLITANRAARSLLGAGVADHLLNPPINVLRVCLHPEGLAPAITNLPAMAAHVLGGLRRQIEALGDPKLAALADELESYPGVRGIQNPGDESANGVAVTMRLRRGDAELALVSMVATFGTAVDATLSELTLETFLPANRETAAWLQDHA